MHVYNPNAGSVFVKMKQLEANHEQISRHFLIPRLARAQRLSGLIKYYSDDATGAAMEAAI